MKRIVMGKDALVDGLWSRGVIGDRTKALTTIERLSADTRDTRRDGCHCQLDATFESLFSYACHTLGDCHVGKAGAVLKSRSSDDFHALGDGHVCQFGTI